MEVVRTVGHAWMKGIVELFEAVGLDVAELFAEAGLDVTQLTMREARFAPEKISALWELAVQRSGNPSLGLAMPELAHPASFDMVVHVMMTSLNLLNAIERLLRYIRIVSDAADIRLHEEDSGYGLSIVLDGGGRPVPRARVEFVVVTIFNILRWLSGRRLRPLSVDFPYPAPVDLEPYRQAFDAPLNFNAPVHQVHFAHSDLAAPLPMANPELAALHDRVAGEYLTRLDRAKTSARVRELIIPRLPDGDPLRADIARQLCLSERTLQRRLQEEGTSFNELVDQIRRELAQQYLSDRRLTMAQAAYLLGFSDQSTFFRACKRWFDTSPGEYRQRSGTCI